MNQQREFLNEAFHVLAQPITALRCTIELGLMKELDGQSSHQVLKECLHLISSLMEDLAVFREIASLENTPPLHSCDGRELVQSCVEEMAIVAEACGSALLVNAEPAAIQCSEPMLRRAMFILLDEMIARGGREISVSLAKNEAGVLLEIRPGMPTGQRQTLCKKLMQLAGSSGFRADAECMGITFQEGYRGQVAPLNHEYKQLLTSHSSCLRNEAVTIS